jgi:AcrR family transcriptional regulator
MRTSRDSNPVIYVPENRILILSQESASVNGVRKGGPVTSRDITAPSGVDHSVPLPDIRVARQHMYRRQVLAAAEREFGRTGYAAAKMSTIAETASLSLATVYKTFGGKAEIWDALHSERMTPLLDAVTAAATETEPGLERLLTSVAAVAEFLAEEPGYHDLNLRAGVNWAADPDAGLGVERTVWRAGLEMITAAVEKAITLGQIQTIRPQVAAGMLVCALQVWLSDWVRNGRDRAPNAVIDEMLRHLRWLLAGPAGSEPTQR